MGQHHASDPADRRRWLIIIAVVLAGLGAAVALPFAVGSPKPRDKAGATPTTTPAARPTERATARPTPKPSTPRPTPTRVRPAPVAPVTYQAEAQDLLGSAWATAYPGASGGEIVRNIGDWGRGRDGTLRFDQVTAPAAGQYRLTFHYVHPDGERSRILVITVNGTPLELTVTGGTQCCTARSVTVRLAAGRNTITFGNPGDHAPSIDRIVVSAP